MYIKGFVTPVWNSDFKELEYIRQPITDDSQEVWKKLGYTHDNTTGKMYDSKNPMPGWVNDVAKEINLKNCGFTIYRMDTLDVMPTHIDHYETYCRVFDKKRDEVRRAVVFLEDWKPGHYFEINGTAVVNYKAGEYVLWSPEVPHAASNIGVEPRYTLQITGTY